MSARTSSESRGGERLAARRRRGRRRLAIALCILLLLLLAAALYGLQQPSVRISHIAVYGGDESLREVAVRAMDGSYLGIIPRNSTFFIPKARIRSEILTAHPDIAAVSFFRSGFTGLTIKVIDRAPIARWCGSIGSSQVSPGEQCYVFDASGVLFALAASTTEAINTFTLYASLQGESIEPMRATIAQADKLPATFDLARTLATVGPAAERIVIQSDEVTVYLTSGTRIVYVLGAEQAAYAALISARDHLNLTDGSLEYVDLRFEGKVYTKQKTGGSEQ